MLNRFFQFRRILGIKLKKFYETKIQDDIQGQLKYGTLYFNKEDGLLSFLCPCGCKEKEILFIEENMDREAGEWAIKMKNNDIKLIGSVGSPHPCSSHYFITYNKIEWLGKL